MGRREDALAATNEAVEMRRRLAAARPDAVEPDLATSLWALAGCALQARFEWELGEAAAEEAHAIYTELARRLPAAIASSHRQSWRPGPTCSTA
jgi:hypothetical protein